MSRELNKCINLNKIGWSFKEVCKIAKEIKPDNWCIIESNDRIAFIELKLPRTGPAVLQKQLVLTNYLQLEIFIGTGKLSDNVLATSGIASVADLKGCLETLESFKTCLGNRNFHRTIKSSSLATTQYWKHSQCLLVYKKEYFRRERCCDSCLTLNGFLPKEKGVVIPAVEEDDEDEDPPLKKIKQEIEIFKEEPTD